MNRFYITTTLPYVNSDPHIGFALEIVQADAIARYQKLKGNEVFFNTGTDEHGLKIFRKAEEAGIEPKTYCDNYASRFDALKDALNLSYNRFIRTTDPDHIKASQEFWRRCAANGDIYKKNYKIKYCVGCELEKTESELEENKCPIHPTMEIELLDEENYFFRYSKYQETLLKHYEENPNFVLPQFRLKEISNFTEKGLEDFSISRLKDKLPWGIPVPDDPDHVMYVWFDALINYVSTLGWPNDKNNFKKWWPTVQIAGKDNLRQQSSMWQAMLLSAGLPMSKQILIHGFITAEGQKMSKSVGNVVDPFVAAKELDSDPLRFFLLREIPTGDDGDFSRERFDIVYDSELANTIGNLFNRVINMTHKYFDGKVPEAPLDPEIATQASAFQARYDDGFVNFNIKAAFESLIEFAQELNAYVDTKKPWALSKDELKHDELATVLRSLLEALRVITVYLQPAMPTKAPAMAEQLGLGDGIFNALPNFEASFEKDHELGEPKPLFPRREE